MADRDRIEHWPRFLRPLRSARLVLHSVALGLRPGPPPPPRPGHDHLARLGAHSPTTGSRQARGEAAVDVGKAPSTARRSTREASRAGSEPGALCASTSPVVPGTRRSARVRWWSPTTTPAGLDRLDRRHAPQGSIRVIAAAVSTASSGRRLRFQPRRGLSIQPEIVANAVSICGGAVALRMDAQTAPRPRLPVERHRARARIHIVESGGPRALHDSSCAATHPGGPLSTPRGSAPRLPPTRRCYQDPRA